MSKKPDHRRTLPKKVAALAATFFSVLTLASLPTPAAAQQQAGQPGPGQVRVDSIQVVGNFRVTAPDIEGQLNVQPGSVTTFRDIQKGVKTLMATGQFSDVRVHAKDLPSSGGVLLVVEVDERPLVRRVEFNGLEHVSAKSVRDTTGLKAGEPFSPVEIQKARTFIQDKLAEKGIPFARIQQQVTPVEGLQNVVDLTLNVTEGNRVTVADVVVQGNDKVSADAIVGAMSTQPEGFLWFKPGAFDRQAYDEDLTKNIPALYHSRGYLDFQVLSDTLVIDPETGKARVELDVEEGPQYRVADFSVQGNREFSDTVLTAYFQRHSGGLLQSLGIGGGGGGERQGEVFDEPAFQAAAQEVQQLYANNGYIYAQVNPVVERRPGRDGAPPTVNLRWDIQEGLPAYINRVAVKGNDYTYDWVVRDHIFILPGDVYSQDRVIQSYQSIASLGFFETPLPPPDIQPDPETGNVDVIFNVKEKQTGSVNFGTSVGGGVGLSGFLGYEQPNLFGQAKSGSLRWDFGSYLSNFELSYSDPAINRSRVSGSLSLFDSRNRFYSFSTGQYKRLGGQVQFGFPIPGALRTRITAGYTIARTTYDVFQGVDDTSLFGRPNATQSSITLGIARNTLNHPLFPTQGSRQSWNIEFNGGPLGGDGNFIKHTAEGTWWVPVGQFGGNQPGGHPVRFALGLSAKAGAIFGNASAFPFDQFWMGGVQFGQPLRGYGETSITPFGYFPENSRDIRDVDRLGDAYLSLTAEYAMRLNDNLSVSTFFDAGNVYATPAEFDPTRLFRGAGFGLQIVTPFGPIGLDYAYGFDKTNPGWQLHFRMGPGF